MRENDDDDRAVSLLALDQYLRQVRWTPPLTQEEEVNLLRQVHRGKVEQTRVCAENPVLQDAHAARDQLVVGYQRLVIWIAKQIVAQGECSVICCLISSRKARWGCCMPWKRPI